MSEEKVGQLFTALVSREPGTEGETGSGLGLLLCGDFVRRLDGRIWAESEPGKGSTFMVEIPC